MSSSALPELRLPKGLTEADVLADYRIAYLSRQVSLIGRREVLSGKAKFGIFGDGKEIAQVALARTMKPGDWRSGYYRDQTLMFALGLCTPQQFFAQLYADADVEREPMSGGRQMNSHFATRYLDQEGNWLDQLQRPNVAADLSPTGAQMGRLVGLGYASKLYRLSEDLQTNEIYSNSGNEVAFGMIGNASAAEGIFWESLNAASVLKIPLAIAVWDDGFGISVPNRYQMTKESVSEACRGFEKKGSDTGLDLYVIRGWDYPTLVETMTSAVDKIRLEHTPGLFHITELTQPQGHSTSGSHERYKTKERLAYEEERDALRIMRAWILSMGLAQEEDLAKIEASSREEAEAARDKAWNDALQPILKERDAFIAVVAPLAQAQGPDGAAARAMTQVKETPTILRRTIAQAARRLSLQLGPGDAGDARDLLTFVQAYQDQNKKKFGSHLLAQPSRSPLGIVPIAPTYGVHAEMIPGNEIIQKYFDQLLTRDPRVFIIGEDVGVLGDVNQNFKGLHEKYGELRITDTGIREATILGQGIGAAMRGLRPLVDIQYLDYLLYCFQLLSDDVASLHYRSHGGQSAPVIVRTKGHRLEGIWHSGSPMGTIIHGLRGLHVCVPRNMVQAVGLYNTLFQGDDPALVIEVLNGYRLREALPENLGTFTVPLGVPEVIREGQDVTLVTYGACIRIAEEASQFLESLGIYVEIIDVQTLLPFDLEHRIAASVRKTNALICMDEDVPGGATSYMLQKILEEQGAYDHLDAPPRTLTGAPHRPAYGSDGDYWSKPSAEDVIELVYDLMHERDPVRFPAISSKI